MLLAMLAFGLQTAEAHGPRPDDGFSLLLGTSRPFDGNLNAVRLSLRGEVGTGRNKLFSSSLLLPLTVTMVNEGGEGFTTDQALFEIPLSVRGRILPDSPVRLYADAGIGAAVGTSDLDGWLIEGTDARVVAMTRTAVGLEVGNPDRLMVAIEPASWSTYFTSERLRARYGLMVGVHLTL